MEKIITLPQLETSVVRQYTNWSGTNAEQIATINNAIQALDDTKQDAITGTMGQVVGFDASGNPTAQAGVLYGECATAAGITTKEVTLANFQLVTGAKITVKFAYANTASAPTLNVNGTGAKYIHLATNKSSTVGITSDLDLWYENKPVEFVYSGSGWVLAGGTGCKVQRYSAEQADKLITARTIDGVAFDGSANITHYGVCSTAAATAAKAVTLYGFQLENGASVRVLFRYAHTADSLTLNVNATGNFPVYDFYNSTSYPLYKWRAGEAVDFVYYDSAYYMLHGGIADTSNYGATKLTSAVDSEDETLAATAKAVKTLYDMIQTANQKIEALEQALAASSGTETGSNVESGTSGSSSDSGSSSSEEP